MKNVFFKLLLFCLLHLIIGSSYCIAQVLFHKKLPDNEEIRSITKTGDGSLFICKDNWDGISQLSQNIILEKSDSLGNEIWLKQYAMSIGDEIIDLGDKGQVIAGLYGGKSGNKSFILKTNINGIPEWYKQYTLPAWFIRINQTSDKGFIVGGGQRLGLDADLILLKTDSAGALQWCKTYGSNQEEMTSYNFNLKIAKENGYFILSNTLGFGNGFINAYLIKTDSDGNVMWSKTYGTNGGTTNEQLFDLLELSDCYYLSASGNSFSGNNKADIYLIKTDKQGNVLWAKSYGGVETDGIDHYNNIILTPDSGLIFNGVTSSFGFGGSDNILLKTDLDGNILWANTYGGPSNEGTFINSVIKQNNALVSFSLTSGFGSTSYAPYMIRMDEHGRSGCNEMDVASLVQVKDITNQLVVTSPQTIVGTGGTLYDTTITYIDVTSSSTVLCYCDVEASFTIRIEDSTVSFKNTSLNFTNLYWEFGDGATSTSTDPEHTYFAGDTVYVTLTATNNGCWDTVRRVVIIPEYIPVPEVMFSSIFSASDGSGFIIKNVQPNTKLVIYDVLGKLQFYSTNYSNSWGSDASAGLYYYQAILPDGEIRKGKVVVVK